MHAISVPQEQDARRKKHATRGQYQQVGWIQQVVGWTRKPLKDSACCTNAIACASTCCLAYNKQSNKSNLLLCTDCLGERRDYFVVHLFYGKKIRKPIGRPLLLFLFLFLFQRTTTRKQPVSLKRRAGARLELAFSRLWAWRDYQLLYPACVFKLLYSSLGTSSCTLCCATCNLQVASETFFRK